MNSRIAIALLLTLTALDSSCANEPSPKLQPGDLLTIKMTGKLGRLYALRTAPRSLPQRYFGEAAVEVVTTARIIRRLDGGRLRVEKTSLFPQNEGPLHEGTKTRLITIEATIDLMEVTSKVTPKGTLVSANPGAKSMPTKKATTMHEVELSDFKNVKFRVWELSEEIGE